MAISHSGGIGHTVSNKRLSNPPVVGERGNSLGGDDSLWLGLRYDE
jgi:hypothetical protein